MSAQRPGPSGPATTTRQDTSAPRTEPLTAEEEARLREAVSDPHNDWRYPDGGSWRHQTRRLLATLDAARASAPSPAELDRIFRTARRLWVRLPEEGADAEDAHIGSIITEIERQVRAVLGQGQEKVADAAASEPSAQWGEVLCEACRHSRRFHTPSCECGRCPAFEPEIVSCLGCGRVGTPSTVHTSSGQYLCAERCVPALRAAAPTVSPASSEVAAVATAGPSALDEAAAAALDIPDSDEPEWSSVLED